MKIKGEKLGKFKFELTHFDIDGCPNGGLPVGNCINMRCARGYYCSPGNICCPARDYGPVISSTANPMKNPFRTLFFLYLNTK